MHDTSTPIVAGSGDDDTASNRETSRDSLFLQGDLRLPGGEATAVRVRNLSAGGLMVDGATPLPVDTMVEIDVRGVGWVEGRIAWQSDGRMGIAFTQPIDPKLARKPVGAGTTTPFYTKAIIATPRRGTY